MSTRTRSRQHGPRSRPNSFSSPLPRTPPPTPTTSPSANSPNQDFESSRKVKLAAIHLALQADPVDVAALRKLAISKGGLLTDELRRRAWPKLLNVNIYHIPSKSTGNLEDHRDHMQVVLDVNRSLKRFPKGMSEQQREVLQTQLVDIIVRVLMRHSQLHYYQGYHDIVVTFLLVVGKELSYALVDQLSTHHLRDFMDSTMDRTKHMLNYLFPILNKANPELHDFMQRSEVGTVFALAWLITWYGHVLNDFRSVVRLYDFFLACHPLMPVYLAAAIVLYREKEILAEECEMPYIHSLLSKIPENLPIEQLVTKAGDLFVQYPPSVMAREARLHYERSHSMSNHPKFELTTYNQRPDAVLKQLKLKSASPGSATAANPLGPPKTSRVVKVAVWALSAGLGAAALAVLNTASEFWQ